VKHLPFLLAFAGLFSACDTLECASGTHRDEDRCVPNVQVGCGEGTVFQDGRCIAMVAPTPDGGRTNDAGLGCGPGTHREGNLCVADQVQPDRGVAADAAVAEDVGPPTDADPPDMAPDMAPPPPRCPPELTPGPPPADCGALPPGSYCILGVAVDFLTGCALPADQGLAALVIDPVAVAGGATPQEAARGQGLIGAHGAFAIQGTGAATQLAMVIDEAPNFPGDNAWTRSVSGVSAAQPQSGQIFRITAFATRESTQAVWNAALGLGERGLEQGGFLVGRVYARDGDALVPAANARVRLRVNANALDCAEAAPCLRFFDDDLALTGFQPQGAPATGRAGTFLLMLGAPPAPPVLQDQFYVDQQDAVYAPLPAGASRGSGFHTAFVPM